MHPVLAADLAEFGLDRYAVRVAVLDDPAGGGQVVRVRQAGAVEHDRGETEIDRLVDEFDVLGVVEMHDHRGIGGLRQREGGQRERPQATVVVDGVLADLHDQRQARRLRTRDEGLGVFKGRGVEGTDPVPAAARGGEDGAWVGEGHATSSCCCIC